jgi:hypothetical protein
MAGKAYSWFHGGRMGEIEGVAPRAIFEYLNELYESEYPYDVVQVRYSIGGDNGPPDPNLPEFVKGWNAKYVRPKMVIATTREMFREFERRYGDRVPEVRGDFTPYWEDGAGSSAKETALARNASDRLVQAEALWAMLHPGLYPCDDFYAAWRNVLLYNEHTWGAHCSISQPEGQFTLNQWKIKQAFALDARDQSRKLVVSALRRAMDGSFEFRLQPADGESTPADDRLKAELQHPRATLFNPRESTRGSVEAVDVFNTTSWLRTDLVVLPADLPLAGSLVRSGDGATVPSQRLATGQLALLATDVPPLGARRFLFAKGDPPTAGAAKAEGWALRTGSLRLSIDDETGAIASLTAAGVPGDLVDRDARPALNDYFYVPSRDPDDAVRNGPARTSVKEPGPLVASLSVECDAPGCRRLIRELRVTDGLARVDLTNVLDKQPVRSKEAVHFGFGFHVPDGVIRMDVPWGVVRPELDQLSGACKNYFTVGRWVDVSNDQYGVTWATVDAPLVEVGGITVDVPSPFDPDAWIRHVEPTQTFYSYVMNNYWETNYKASQEGVALFRYSIMPHQEFDAAAAARFGIERSQPLLPVPVDPHVPAAESLFRIEPESVLVSSLKPSDDGKAWIIRLYNAADAPARATITWNTPRPETVSLSSPFEEKGPVAPAPIDVPALGIVTLRAELPD